MGLKRVLLSCLVLVLSLCCGVYASSFVYFGGPNQTVLKYDITSDQFLGTFADAGESGLLTGMAFYDGYLYAAGYSTSKIYKFDATSGDLVDTISSGGIYYPRGMTIGPDGNIYVASNNVDILKYSPSGTYLGVYASAASGMLTGIAFDASGVLYASNYGGNNVMKYSGGSLVNFATDPQLIQPIGLDWGPDGDLYVSSSANDSVYKFDASTGASHGAFITSAGELDFPYGLGFGPDDNLYVAAGYNALVRYDGVTGEFMGTLASDNNITYLAFSSDGTTIPEPATLILLGCAVMGLIRKYI